MALPTLPPTPQNLGADDNARKEYFDAINKTLAALEARANQGVNLWNVAGQFFNPGRTGNFGEALGNVATAVGRDVEKQNELAIPVAQMRASIAGQKYQVENEAKALQLFSEAIGLTPQQAAGAINSGTVTPDMINKIPSNLFVAINKLDPKLGGAVKDAFNMDVERRKLVNEDIKNGLNVTDLIAKYGEGVVQYLPKSLQPGSQPSSGTSQTSSVVDSLKTDNPPDGKKTVSLLAPADLAKQIEDDFGIKLGPLALTRTREQQQSLINRHAAGEKGIYKPAPVIDGKDTYHEGAIDVPTSVPESYLRARGYHRPDKNDPVHAVPIPDWKPAGGTTATTTQPSGKKVDVSSIAIDSDLKDLPLGVQAEVKKSRAQSSDKMYEAHRNEIISHTPQMVAATSERLRELHAIADTNPRIFGLMQQKGLLSALKNSAQEGIQAGRLGSISLPVQTFVEKQNLSPTEQKVLRRAAQLLAEQFFEDAKANKSVLGPQISNVDAEFMQRPMVTEKDAASTVQYWVKNHLLLNAQRGELFRSLQQHDQRVGTRAPFGSYFGSDDYLGIVNKYSNLNKQLRQRYPDFGSK